MSDKEKNKETCNEIIAENNFGEDVESVQAKETTQTTSHTTTETATPNASRQGIGAAIHKLFMTRNSRLQLMVKVLLLDYFYFWLNSQPADNRHQLGQSTLSKWK